MSLTSPLSHQQQGALPSSNGAPPSSESGGSSSSTPAPPPMTEAPQMMPPPFFANPFMQTFIPQQMDPLTGVSPSGVPHQPAGMVPGAMSGAPGAPPFFMTPQGYQDMMQQYFQQMMVAAQQAGPGGVYQQVPFPMPFYNPAMMQSMSTPPRAPSEADTIDRLSSGVGEVSIGEGGGTPEHRSIQNTTGGVSSLTSTPAHFSSSPAPPPLIESHPQNELFDGMDDVHEERKQNGDGGGMKSDVAESVVSTLVDDSTSNEKENGDEEEEKRKSSLPDSTNSSTVTANGGDDERTTNLIRKQMSEMEKEINRRAQNKNIKKIDDTGLAELIGSTSPPQFVAHFEAMEQHQQQAALPFSAGSGQALANESKESLNQLRNSFQIPENQATFAPVAQTQPVVMHQPSPIHQQQSFVPQSMMFQPTTVPPTVPTVPTVPSQPTVTATVPTPLVPPPRAGAPVTRAPQSTTSTTTSTVPPRINPFTTPIQHPYMQQAPPQQQQQQQFAGWDGQPSTSGHVNGKPTDGWPEQSGDGSEPVWVLRDSYMKKMQQQQAAAAAGSSEWDDAGTTSTATVTTQPTVPIDDDEEETDRLLHEGGEHDTKQPPQQKKGSKETMVHEPAVLIEGVLFRARYLGSTQMTCDTRGSKSARMAQAQEAVARVKAPDGEVQPGTDIDLFISTEKIMVLNTDLQRISDTDVRQDILMDHALRTISYIADIGDIVVLMARRMTHSSSNDSCSDGEPGVKKAPKVVCHVFESDEAAFIAQSIGQAFQVAYVEFLRANGIDDPSYLRQIDYQEVLNSQELLGDELEMFARKETQKDVVVPKRSGEPLGVVVVESGWGSMLPTVVIAHLAPTAPASRCNQLNVGDQIIAINGISLVGLPLSTAQTHIRNVKTSTAVRLTIVSTPPVVEVRIRRPDTKYQLGFSVQNGVICSLLRGGIAERGGIRVGHRIIEINGQSVVAVAHERIVHMLATAIGDIHMKTMPTSMFRLLTGQEVPNYI